MARLKDRGFVKKRDTSFARRLEVGLAADQRQPASEAAPLAVAEVQTEQERAVQQPSKPAAPAPAPAPAKPESSSRQKEKAARTEKGRGVKSKIRLAFRMPDDLVLRAATWAEKARCPVNAILRKGFNDLRPILIGSLEAGIRYTEIPHERVGDASHSFDTTVMIDSVAADRIANEIDPEDITGVEAPLSRWARARFIEHFDDYLRAKGY